MFIEFAAPFGIKMAETFQTLQGHAFFFNATISMTAENKKGCPEAAFLNIQYPTRNFQCPNQTAKLSPQPQVRVAFGLLNEKPLPSRPPENSSVVLNRYRKLLRSVTTFTPLFSKT
jgi:hypothetical protein